MTCLNPVKVAGIIQADAKIAYLNALMNAYKWNRGFAMAKSICYDYRTDILILTDDVVELAIKNDFNARYFLHHRAKRSGYVREGRCLIRPYSGRFGSGFILASNAGHGNVWVDYYIKGE